MKPVVSYAWAALVVAAGVSGGAPEARAMVDDSPILNPPDGWQHLCVGNTITLTPSVSERVYAGTGVCWINVAQGSRQDPKTQNWHRVQVRFEGGYALQQQRFRETIVVDTPTGKVTVADGGACSDDPWLKGATCGSVAPNVDLANSFGWAVKPQQDGPLSRGVFDPAVILALTSKQASSTPNAPVDLDAVRWPEAEGKVGRIFWRAPDVSGNKWILAYDVEYSSSPDSAFAAAGKGPRAGRQVDAEPEGHPALLLHDVHRGRLALLLPSVLGERRRPPVLRSKADARADPGRADGSGEPHQGGRNRAGRRRFAAAGSWSARCAEDGANGSSRGACAGRPSASLTAVVRSVTEGPAWTATAYADRRSGRRPPLPAPTALSIVGMRTTSTTSETTTLAGAAPAPSSTVVSSSMTRGTMASLTTRSMRTRSAKSTT